MLDGRSVEFFVWNKRHKLRVLSRRQELVDEVCIAEAEAISVFRLRLACSILVLHLQRFFRICIFYLFLQRRVLQHRLIGGSVGFSLKEDTVPTLDPIFSRTYSASHFMARHGRLNGLSLCPFVAAALRNGIALKE